MVMSAYMKSLRDKVGTMLVGVPSATTVVRDEVGRVLLVRHADTGYWAVPGGAVDPHETPADAAVRELWEETGLYVRLTRLAGVFGGTEFIAHYEGGDRTSYVTIVFEGEVLAGEAAVRDEEILEVRYFSRQEAAENPLVPACIRELLESVFGEDGERTPFRPATWAPPRV
jgi:8-oxo-dGTP pyrophosphatase MutT (NUDIX family)